MKKINRFFIFLGILGLIVVGLCSCSNAADETAASVSVESTIRHDMFSENQMFEEVEKLREIRQTTSDRVRNKPPLNDVVRVHFFRTTDGAVSVIQQGHSAVVIDTGAYRDRSDTLAFLDLHSIWDLPYVFITSRSDGYIGGLPVLLGLFPIDNLVLPAVNTENNDEVTSAVLKLIEKDKEDFDLELLVAPSKGTKFNMGNVNLEVVYPFSINNKPDKEKSLIINAEIYGNNFLFMSNHNKRAEQELKLNNPKTDVLRVSDAGRNSGSETEFLKILGGELAIVSDDNITPLVGSQITLVNLDYAGYNIIRLSEREYFYIDVYADGEMKYADEGEIAWK